MVGELWNYPQEWFPSVDGVMNFTLREIILRSASQRLAPAAASAMITRVVADAGVENLLKSWLMLDNHDTDRLASSLPNPAQRHLAQVLQFTLPGAPNLYYGSELGMTGAGDPGMRAPMRWDLVTDANPELKWTRQLIALRQQHRALRVGNYRAISSEKLIAFERTTDRAAASDSTAPMPNTPENPATPTTTPPSPAAADQPMPMPTLLTEDAMVRQCGATISWLNN